MKKRYLLFFFSILFSLYTVQAQSCLPTGFTFASQAQIDAFPANFPGCSHIVGNVFIEQSLFGNVRNLDSLAQIDSISGSLRIRYNNALSSLRGLDQLLFVGGDVSLVTNETLSSLNGLKKLASIGGALSVFSSDALLDLGGLQKLTSIGTYLSLSENASMINLRGLENLTSIGSNLLIQSNPSLQSLNGIDNLKGIGGALRILNNSKLIDLSSLGNLMSIDGPLRVLDNSALTNLHGLDKLDGQTITDLSITGSPQLSVCGVRSICDYLSTASNQVFLNGNAVGCSTRVQIETACAALVGLDELDRIEISVYPNPSSGKIELRGLVRGNVRILNMFGELVLEKSFDDASLDLSELPGGIYFLHIQAGEKWAIQKIVKQ